MNRDGEDKPKTEPVIARADLGVPARLLPPGLASQYFVETFYEDQVMQLVTEDPSRITFLERVAPALHSHFGCDARLMLAAPWSLFDPIGPELHVVVYTGLSESDAAAANKHLQREWSNQARAAGVQFDITPMSRVRALEQRQP